MSLEAKRQLMDKIWHSFGCDNKRFDPQRYSQFYNHPIWLLHGILQEEHDLAMTHRHAICGYIAGLNPSRVCDYGGGFGTLARLLATKVTEGKIHICEPHPPLYGSKLCSQYDNISYVSRLDRQYYDVVVSVDVLEHVQDPISVLAELTDSLRVGGHLVIANCFYPVIACHLPSTFHLRYSFDKFCDIFGLARIGPCDGSHATVYQRISVKVPNWGKIRRIENLSKALYIAKEIKSAVKQPFVTAFTRATKIIRKA